MRQPVKAMTTHPRIVTLRRHGVVADVLTVGAMNGGLEPVDIHEVGPMLPDHRSINQVTRLMRRCPRLSVNQRAKNTCAAARCSASLLAAGRSSTGCPCGPRIRI